MENIKLKELDVVEFGEFRIEAVIVDGEKVLRIIANKWNLSVHPRQHNSVSIKISKS